MKKLVLSVVALSIMAVGILYAIDREEKQELMQSFGDEMRAYAEENIHPQLNEWKTQIDNKISSEDLETLNQLRAEAEEFRNDMMEKRHEMKSMKGNHMKGKGMKGNKGKGRKGKNLDENKMMKHNKNKFSGELGEIIENYPDYFDGLFTEVEEKQEIWKDDMKEIRDNWFEENEDVLNEMKGNKGKMKHKMRFEKMNNRFSNPEHILLWNGVPPRMPQMRENQKLNNIKAYNSPNPFNETTEITYIIEETGNYQIEIINASGNIIEKLYDGNLNEGENSFTFSATNKEPGVYFYKISGQNFEQTNKMVISK